MICCKWLMVCAGSIHFQRNSCVYVYEMVFGSSWSSTAVATAGSVVLVLMTQTSSEPQLEHDLLVARVSWQSRALLNERWNYCYWSALFCSFSLHLCKSLRNRSDQTSVLTSCECYHCCLALWCPCLYFSLDFSHAGLGLWRLIVPR